MLAFSFPTNPSPEGSSVEEHPASVQSDSISTQLDSSPREDFLTFKQVLETLASPPTPSPFEMGDWVITPEGHTGIVIGKGLHILDDEPTWEYSVIYLEIPQGEDEGTWDEMFYSTDELKAASREQITEMVGSGQ
ncbi:MAG: hypothetical protein SFW36_01285 [Leptolyngbyaceae cyanobacterium bins.59]|nr:hypothetical protein [Leptolyngbyaceae cyanobacterium bins.59]